MNTFELHGLPPFLENYFNRIYLNNSPQKHSFFYSFLLNTYPGPPIFCLAGTILFLTDQSVRTKHFDVDPLADQNIITFITNALQHLPDEVDCNWLIDEPTRKPGVK
jgi:hypothetical protein